MKRYRGGVVRRWRGGMALASCGGWTGRLARGRRTVTSWIRAAGLSGEYRRRYTTCSAAGKRTNLIAASLAHDVVKLLVVAPCLRTGEAGEARTRVAWGTKERSKRRKPPGRSAGQPLLRLIRSF